MKKLSMVKQEGCSIRACIATLNAIVFLLLLFGFPTQTLADDFYDTDRFFQSASALVMDWDTGEVIFNEYGFTRRYPASITKVMTALIVLENVTNLNQPVVFSAEAVDLPNYAARIGIVEGESMTVREALFGIMLPSGNEVARALAEHVSGSVPDFVAKMNQRAFELGAYDTRFVNPCGLPGFGQFVTAYDVSLIFREATTHPLFMQIINTQAFSITPTEYHEYPRLIRNTHRMIRPEQPEFNPYIIGGKTGSTNAAGHTLVSYARRDDRSVIVTVLYAPRHATFTDTAALLDYVFTVVEDIPPVVQLDDLPPVMENMILYDPFPLVEVIEVEIITHEQINTQPEPTSFVEEAVIAPLSLIIVLLGVVFLRFIIRYHHLLPDSKIYSSYHSAHATRQ